ncbi:MULTISPECIES: ribbon-helix-helix domain-containing protein [Enterococcus]|uniref:ribbon-helix-helix domain-containing protein n=1 Tax=Enterococcus TaxID=1350 RepID=UPI000BA13156|nr:MULTISPECIES: CopG family transcriptional regulator [Enterococcus]EGO7794281.1 ribbon-helix-helix protein, CopG family [Enterococcus faecalis]EGO8273590.1 ribbon-helix-helix protein, CopG family [Enterococcus faecalis]ELT8931846.1 ribbon-helix-helix protein, CopG family [Enterococcus faecalis]OZS36168.1 CopG family transcriptional regulator [Enterococcus faecium]PQD64934.1 ribbon-helix-helix protein, CopG family [Enterococcus faecalis]
MAYKKRITISLSDKVLENLENLSKEKGLSKSAMITLALEEYVRKESEQKK